MPEFTTTGLEDWVPEIELRTLPDGVPQLRVGLGDRIRVIRLSRSPSRVEVATTGEVGTR